MSEDKNTLDNILKPENTEKTEIESKEPSSKGDVVEVKKSDLDALMKRITRLEKTSNKKRLDGYDRLNDEDSETIYKLRIIDGKVITHWSRLHTNKAEVNPVTRRIEEDQKLTVYFEDDTKEDMDLIVFNRRYEYIYTTLVEEKILKKPEEIKKYGDRIFTVETEEGKKYQIGELFIN